MDKKEEKRVNDIETDVWYEMTLKLIEDFGYSVELARGTIREADWYYGLEEDEFDPLKDRCEFNGYWIEFY